jgi:hypothetical protein
MSIFGLVLCVLLLYFLVLSLVESYQTDKMNEDLEYSNKFEDWMEDLRRYGE